LNDSGDLELFLSSTSDDWVVVTAEKRWADIAARARYPQRLRKVCSTGSCPAEVDDHCLVNSLNLP
jgi:hypothetical protein